jgi:hypothetical protein
VDRRSIPAHPGSADFANGIQVFIEPDETSRAAGTLVPAAAALLVPLRTWLRKLSKSRQETLKQR